MKNLCDEMPNGYSESIRQGLTAARCFGGYVSLETETKEERIIRLKQEIEMLGAIVIGVGAGFSASAELTCNGERFKRYFFDFAKKYGIHDICTGGLYPFPGAEARWMWWARHIYFNRYIEPPRPVCRKLLTLVKDKDYFAITTNVDHQFLRAGFDQKRLFYTQGDYGPFQTVDDENDKTYDNREWVIRAMTIQGSVGDANGVFRMTEDGKITMRVPAELIPKCPDDGADLTMNLRADNSFAEDAGWHRASAAYSNFLRRYENLRVLYLELGVGGNTPVIVRYPFWQMTLANKNTVYAYVNYGGAFYPREIVDRSICIDGDIGEVLEFL